MRIAVTYENGDIFQHFGHTEEFKVYEAVFEEKKETSCGKVVEILKDKIGITCQDGVIYLKRIKPFGKKVMDVKDYLNGISKDEVQKWVIE